MGAVGTRPTTKVVTLASTFTATHRHSTLVCSHTSALGSRKHCCLAGFSIVISALAPATAAAAVAGCGGGVVCGGGIAVAVAVFRLGFWHYHQQQLRAQG